MNCNKFTSVEEQGCQFQNEKKKHRDVGELRFPNGELILLYPGIGQTNPFGLIARISELSLE